MTVDEVPLGSRCYDEMTVMAVVVIDRKGQRRLLIPRTCRVTPMAFLVSDVALTVIPSTRHTINTAFE